MLNASEKHLDKQYGDCIRFTMEKKMVSRRRSSCDRLFFRICTDHKLYFCSCITFLSVSVVVIKLIPAGLKIITVKFECVIVILEWLKYAWDQI